MHHNGAILRFGDPFTVPVPSAICMQDHHFRCKLVSAKNIQRNHKAASIDHGLVHPELVPDKGAPQGAHSTTHGPNASYTSKMYHVTGAKTVGK